MNIARRRRIVGPVQNIGDAHGRIALWLDERSARDLAELLHSDDMGRAELIAAIDRAYIYVEDDDA